MAKLCSTAAAVSQWAPNDVRVLGPGFRDKVQRSGFRTHEGSGYLNGAALLALKRDTRGFVSGCRFCVSGLGGYSQIAVDRTQHVIRSGPDSGPRLG